MSFCTRLGGWLTVPKERVRQVKEETKKLIKELMSGGYHASAIGMALVLAIVIGAGVGYWLSQVFNNMLFFYLGLLAGIIAGFRNIYIMGKRTKL